MWSPSQIDHIFISLTAARIHVNKNYLLKPLGSGSQRIKKKKQTTNQHSRFEKTHNTHSFIHRPQFLQNTSILELILLLRATVASQRTVQPGIIRALTAEYMRERITKPRWRNIFSDCNLAIGSFLKDTQFLFWHI